MRRLLCLIIVVVFIGCGPTSNLRTTSTSLKWHPLDMRPSQIKRDGSIFYTTRLNNTEGISIYRDESLNDDETYYYNQLMESFGWTRDGDGFRASKLEAINPSRGILYISVRRGVAVYLYPDNTFAVYKVIRTVID
jgi:hypothetical protein